MLASSCFSWKLNVNLHKKRGDSLSVAAIGVSLHLKCLFLTFNILLESKIHISLCTDFIFIDHLIIS